LSGKNRDCDLKMLSPEFGGFENEVRLLIDEVVTDNGDFSLEQTEVEIQCGIADCTFRPYRDSFLSASMRCTEY
jgi:hypothetical protein